ncbi:MAG: RNA-binding cell elongation regulator Jag/EloR [Acidimicrobiales bacterium]
MEWVEVTGKTVDEAKEAALDQLGVAERDAELIIVAEPKTGLFGRVRGEARVRARVQPLGPKPKRNRRPREKTRAPGRDNGSAGRGRAQGRDTPGSIAPAPGGGGGQRSGAETGSGRSRSARRRRSRSNSRPAGAGGASKAGTEDGARAGDRDNTANGARAKEETAMAEGMTLEEQAEVARGFLQGLLDQFGLEATVDTKVLDEETVELAATGEGLGILVGPKGSTLAALQDVTRTVVQRNFPSRTDRILVDVAGYREKRAAALQKFSHQVAAEVIESGSERALEPMSPADRKVVHDAVNEIDGVATRSEGEDPARYIVIAPAG